MSDLEHILKSKTSRSLGAETGTNKINEKLHEKVVGQLIFLRKVMCKIELDLCIGEPMQICIH